jgi:hypothetical protein
MSISPAAQAVLDAYHAAPIVGVFPQGADALGVAAALRAAADQVVPEDDNEPNLTEFSNRGLLCNWCEWYQRGTTRNRILAIAAELEGGQ